MNDPERINLYQHNGEEIDFKGLETMGELLNVNDDTTEYHIDFTIPDASETKVKSLYQTYSHVISGSQRNFKRIPIGDK